MTRHQAQKTAAHSPAVKAHLAMATPPVSPIWLIAAMLPMPDPQVKLVTLVVLLQYRALVFAVR